MPWARVRGLPNKVAAFVFLFVALGRLLIPDACACNNRLVSSMPSTETVLRGLRLLCGVDVLAFEWLWVLDPCEMGSVE